MKELIPFVFDVLALAKLRNIIAETFISILSMIYNVLEYEQHFYAKYKLTAILNYRLSLHYIHKTLVTCQIGRAMFRMLENTWELAEIREYMKT